MYDEFVEAVGAVVSAVPAGTVLSYKDVSELARSGGPRQVGHVMAHYGHAWAWWRVIRADGSLPGHLFAMALPEYAREGTPLNSAGTRVDMKHARWKPSAQQLAQLDRLLDA